MAKAIYMQKPLSNGVWHDVLIDPTEKDRFLAMGWRVKDGRTSSKDTKPEEK